MLPERKLLTLIDLDAIDDDNRYELIDGDLYLLAAPAPPHVLVSSRLLKKIQSYLGNGRCEAFHAPADVYLFNRPGDPDSDITTVVQPDLFVVCDSQQIGKQGFYGPPTLVVEILSPSTAGIDRFIKYEKYQRAGVQEYWIVDPQHRIVSVYTLTDGRYGGGVAYSGTLCSGVFPGLEVPLSEIFPES